MTTDEPGRFSDEQYHAVIPLRLAAPGSASDTIVEDLGLADVIDVAEWCYAVRGAGRMLPPDAVPFETYSRWLRSALGLAGSIAESLVVCVGCEVELDMLRATGGPAVEIGGRFFSIASSQEIIGVGHRLVNMVQRAASARSDYRELLQSSTDGALAACAAYDDPRSAHRNAWLSLNVPTVRALQRALTDVPHRSIKNALGEISSLVESSEWVTLNDTRGEVFHRSRPESSIVSGLDSQSGYVTPILGHDGQTIGYSVGASVRYAGGDDRWAQEAAATQAALHRVALAVRAVTTALVQAIEPLSNGSRRAERTAAKGVRIHHQIGSSWSDERCSCCAAAQAAES